LKNIDINTDFFWKVW